MITPTLFAHAGEWAAHGVKFLLVGDTFQLPPVISTREVLEKFGEDYSVFSRVKGANLETVMRNAGGVLRAATKIRETGRLPRESDFDDASQTSGYRFVPDTTPITRATDEYVADMKDHMLITWRNETRMRANNRIRALLGRGGELPDPGEPVLIRKNGQGFLNGEIVECVDYEAGPQVDSVRTLWMTVRCAAGDVKILVSFDGGDKEKGGQFFDGSMPWIQNWRNYHATLKREMLPDPTPVTWGYCLTAHTAQGSEARRVTIFLERRDIHSRNFAKQTTLPDGSQATFAARFLYTAVTRAQKLTSMILGT